VYLSYSKINFVGILLPPLHLNSSLEQNFTQPTQNNYLILGRFGLEISKDFKSMVVSHRTEFVVNVTVENTGNIAIGNFTIDDMRSYDAVGFTLENGLMLKNIPLLYPGESVSFHYTLRTLKKNGIYAMNPVLVKYYFVFKYVNENDISFIKVKEIYIQTILSILLPITIGVGVMIFTYKRKMKYSSEDFELERRESLLFGQSLRQIAWKKQNLMEFFENQTIVEEDNH
jgi:hypothetical protein